jgi:DNA-binding PadR family transcriptional regulator
MFYDTFMPRRAIHRWRRRHFGGRCGPGPDFGPDFMGGRGFPGGRRLSASELQLILLALLAERPAHGYELIRTLEERSGGFYAPSPGMIYPALTYLEEIGHVGQVQEANRKLYSITEAGRAHLEANRERATAILEALRRIGDRMEEVRAAFAGEGDLDPQAAEALHAARHALKHALMRKRGCAPDEARRIAQILERATAEILGRDG